MMDAITQYMEMPLDEVDRIARDMEVNKDKYTSRDKLAIQYVIEAKNLTDYLDRHVSKAPTNLEVQGSLTLGDMKKLFEDDPNDTEG
jgi:hypothetical protein